MKHKSGLLLCVLQSLLLLWAFGGYATVSTPSVFGDHMVLQQQKALPVWGKAEPGETVTVSLNGKSDSATACPEGRWLVHLPKLPAGGPYELKIAGKDNTLIFTDVLLGEVWIGSGQSNMNFSVNRSANAEKEIAEA